MKLSKSAKMRIKRMSAADKKKLAAAARFLADYDCITAPRAVAIMRTCNSSNGVY
tara:strand:+ start:382 stop:546 length:165 start_codon:yes stop_codon:yes gene_type:complete